MGRKGKKAKKVVTKKKQVVNKTFKCPFCGHDGSVEVKLDRERATGTATCRICGADFQSRINYLSEAVDVFCDWIDECEAEKEGGDGAGVGDF